MTRGRGLAGRRHGLADLLRRGLGWLLDYAYVARWQVWELFDRQDPAPYLEAASPDAAAGAAPVVLLPGIYETWRLMRPVADLVHGLGHPVHAVTALGRNSGQVPAMARLVADYLSSRSLEHVVIIAHSKGGLIGKYLMASAEAGPRIERMIAVSTPFSGSVYARFAPLPSLRAFSPTNTLLRTLLANLSVNARITSIYSIFDPHIPGGSRLAGARNVVLDTMGHFRLLGDPRLLAAVETALTEAPGPAHDGGPGGPAHDGGPGPAPSGV